MDAIQITLMARIEAVEMDIRNCLQQLDVHARIANLEARMRIPAAAVGAVFGSRPDDQPYEGSLLEKLINLEALVDSLSIRSDSMQDRLASIEEALRQANILDPNSDLVRPSA